MFLWVMPAVWCGWRWLEVNMRSLLTPCATKQKYWKTCTHQQWFNTKSGTNSAADPVSKHVQAWSRPHVAWVTYAGRSGRNNCTDRAWDASDGRKTHWIEQVHQYNPPVVKIQFPNYPPTRHGPYQILIYVIFKICKCWFLLAWKNARYAIDPLVTHTWCKYNFTITVCLHTNVAVRWSRWSWWWWWWFNDGDSEQNGDGDGDGDRDEGDDDGGGDGHDDDDDDDE